MECIFCKIALGEIPSYKIFEDDRFISFLDIFPTMKGQVIIIPKRHEGEYIFDMNSEFILSLFEFSKKISLALEKSFNSKKIGVIFEGLEVSHLHMKLYPLNTFLDLKTKLEFSPDEFLEILNLIKSNLN